ncbi:MAG: DUF11 domain-containing protein, partial [Deltaproteobacteria bacterium]|nr:DUF11 domain-containing protein [Deltaproteobacteria bacterium]
DATTFTVRAIANLTATTKGVKNLSRLDGLYHPGDTIEYAIRVVNTGDATATRVVLKDVVDAGLTNVALGSVGSLAGSTITWDANTIPQLQQLDPGSTVTITFDAKIVTTATDGQIISNQAAMTWDELGTSPPQLTDDPATELIGDPTRLTVVAGPRLAHSIKTVTNVTGTGGVVRPGDVLEYELHVLNDGGESARNTLLVDTIPPRTHYVLGTTKLNGNTVPDLAQQTQLVTGMVVTSARAGTPIGTILSSSGAVPDDTVATVTFRVQVDDDAVTGTVISNQGLLRADKIAQASTDDPTTPTAGDPTEVVVGASALVRAYKTWSLVGDAGNAGVVDVGDTIQYTIELENRGSVAAKSLVFTDALPPQITYVPGSLTLDGSTLSDARDGDAGESIDNGSGIFTVRVALDQLAIGAHRTITVRAKVAAGPRFSNQATVTGPGGITVLTDGDPSLQGEQPTVTNVGLGAGPDLSPSVKTVLDENGGDVLPGDVLLYTITLVNAGSTDVTNGALDDVLPLGLEYVDNSLAGDGTLTFVPAPALGGQGTVRGAGLTVKANGGRAQIRFRARVGRTVAVGSSIRNEAGARTAPDQGRLAIPPATVVVGQAQGMVGLTGKVWRDLDLTSSITPVDQPLRGLQVFVRRIDALDGPPLRSSITGALGQYSLPDLPKAAYRVEVMSEHGAHLAEADAVFSPDSTLLMQDDVLVQPMGAVVRGDDKAPLANARVFLLYDDSEVGKTPPACDPDQSNIALAAQPLLSGRTLPRLVPDACLRGGQQGQTTGPLGLYRFDLGAATSTAPARTDAAFNYRLEIDSGTPLLSYPGRHPAPTAGFAGPGAVVSEGDPTQVKVPRWYQRFTLRSGDQVFNNHAALDPSSLSLVKTATRTSATAGEVVGYTISLQNPSSQDVLVDANGSGGVRIADVLPDDFRYARNTARVVRLVTTTTGVERHCARIVDDGKGAGCAVNLADPAKTELGKSGATAGKFLDFGPYDLRAGEQLELHYQAIVGAEAKPGDHANHAVARVGNVEVSNSDTAIVRVAQDPLFDLASLMGKVYCEKDAAQGMRRARQGAGEEGVPGVRIYEDEGFVAETDTAGKFHFKGL